MAANAEGATNAQVDIAPGFRFQPTDQELVNCYLRPKVLQELQLNFIPEVDLYKCEPWELPDKAFSSSSGADGSKVEWYLFAPRDRKYGPKSVRMNRATPIGFWKSTGKDRSVMHHHMDAVIGKKKTLVYHHGRAPNGERTDWVMREYRLHHDGMAALQDTYALCRIFNKEWMQFVPDGADEMQFVPGGADEMQFVPDGFEDNSWMKFMEDYWMQFVPEQQERVGERLEYEPGAVPNLEPVVVVAGAGPDGEAQEAGEAAHVEVAWVDDGAAGLEVAAGDGQEIEE